MLFVVYCKNICNFGARNNLKEKYKPLKRYMRMKKLGILLSMFVAATLSCQAQGAKSIRITEVMTDNRTSIVDEYGKHKPWVELSNTSFTTYNVRGMFLTTDRRVLDKKMSPEERRKLMCPLPNNEPRTTLAGKKSLIIYDKAFWILTGWNNKDTQLVKSWYTGDTEPFHLALGISNKGWIGLYDGNAVDLIDSVRLPRIPSDCTYALWNDFKTWKITDLPYTTPGYLPQPSGLSKPQMLKQTDPHGFGIAALSMGIVFSCLALLFVFFWAFGAYMKYKLRIAKATEKHATLLYKTGKKTIEVTSEIGHKTNVMLKDGLKTKGIDKEIYMAVIALALKDYLEDVHDVEPGIITIKPKQTRWNAPKFNNNSKL